MMRSEEDREIIIKDVETFRTAQKVLGAKPSNESQKIVWKSFVFYTEARDAGYFPYYAFQKYMPPLKFPFLVAMSAKEGGLPNWPIHLYALFYHIWGKSRGVMVAQEEDNILFIATRKRFIFSTVAIHRVIDDIKNTRIHKKKGVNLFVDANRLNNTFANVAFFPQELSSFEISDMTDEDMERLINE